MSRQQCELSHYVEFLFPIRVIDLTTMPIAVMLYGFIPYQASIRMLHIVKYLL